MKTVFHLCGNENDMRGVVYAKLITECEFFPRPGDMLDIGNGGQSLPVVTSSYHIVYNFAEVYIYASASFIRDVVTEDRDDLEEHGWKLTDHALEYAKVIKTR